MSYTIRNVDRLSSLPEEVHSHILSLMPTKYAVRTSILSRTWRYKWMLVTNLDFDDSHRFHDLDCFTQFVDRVLELQKSPQVKLFRMCFSEMWVKKSKVLKWIDAAVRLHVSELDVKAMLLELPLCLFTCRTLTKLRLYGMGVGPGASRSGAGANTVPPPRPELRSRRQRPFFADVPIHLQDTHKTKNRSRYPV
ncbi:putative F-box domain, leucine-rich repeat domain superfamily, F-box-like domain superfamily [Helianthus annuus]|nr:putative F-box domain, leucine-rich repeat domain superfamily, F-box-like domain superfamily [Helianthus annuus]